MDIIALLDQGYGWTTGRVAAVRPGQLGAPTPCAEWSVLELARELVDGHHGGFFGPDLEFGDTPSDRLVAFLGRKP